MNFCAREFSEGAFANTVSASRVIIWQRLLEI